MSELVTRLGRLVVPDAEADRRRRRAEESARLHRSRELWNLSEVPCRHAEGALRPPPMDPEHPWVRTRAHVLASLGGGVSICLAGPRGNGKTQIAVDAVLKVTGQGRAALFRTAHRLLMEFKTTFDRRARLTEVQVLDGYRRPRLLVVDEMGQGTQSDWEQRTLFEVLNARYNDLTDTILTRNLGVEDLKRNVGPSLVSRMREGGGIVECDWPSFRP